MFSKKNPLKETNKIRQQIVDAVQEYVLESLTKDEEKSEFSVMDAYSHYAYSLVNVCDVESRWVGHREFPVSVGVKSCDRSIFLESLTDGLTRKQADVFKLLSNQEYFSLAVPEADMWTCRHLEFFVPGTERTFNCPPCSATGRITCTTCNRAGKVICKKCNGKMWVNQGDRRIRCDQCDTNGYVVCQPCNGSGTIQCKRCEGDGRLIEFDFFAICNSGDLSLVNFFPKPKFGAVEKMAQERLFHLGKDKCTEVRNLLRGRMKPFKDSDQTSRSLPPHPFGAHEDFVLEGKTTLVVEVERLDKSKPLGDAKIPLDVKEKELVSRVSLESSNWLRENLPLGDKSRIIRGEKIVLNQRPYHVLRTKEGDNYFVTMNPTQVTTESSLSWEKCMKHFKQFSYLGGVFACHRFYLKRFYLAALHLTLSAWMIILLSIIILNFDSNNLGSVLFWFALICFAKIFWMMKENKLLHESRILDIDGSPLVNPNENDSNSHTGIETLPKMNLKSLEGEEFKLLHSK